MKKTHLKFVTLIASIFSILLISCGEVKTDSSESDSKQKEEVPVKEPKEVFKVEALTNDEYTISGTTIEKAENPDLTLKRGETYKFDVDAMGHPFFIKTKKTVGPKYLYENGVTDNGKDYGAVIITVPSDAPDTLFYTCKYHDTMSGNLVIVD